MNDSANQNAHESVEASFSVWIISEGNPGHVSQSRGLAAALQEIVPLTIEQFECRQRGSGGWRALFRFLFKFCPRWRRFWARLSTRVQSMPQQAPRLLIASGGKSVFMARFLADHYAAPLVYCGNPAPYPKNWFDCILSTDVPPERMSAKWIQTDVLMNTVTPQGVAEAAARYSLKQHADGLSAGPVGTLLVGGRSRSQCFAERDWLALSQLLNRLASEQGWRWLIATSRRTGAEVEKLLHSSIRPESVLDAVWWETNPRKVVRPFLGHADMVLVGSDSMTMISEAVCSGRPVVIYEPKQKKPSPMIDHFIENLSRKKLALIAPCSAHFNPREQLSSLVPWIRSPQQDYAEQVWQRVQQR